MARPAGSQPHKLFVAVLAAPGHSPADVRRLVETRFGPVDAELEPHRFTLSAYYEREMGPDLWRSIVSVGPLVDPSRLAELKALANAVELEHARLSGEARQADGGLSGAADPPPTSRTINLDPGLLSLSRVMLATTKPSAHRIPLANGLHAEITLLYRHGRYTPLEWTYPDYRSEPFLAWLATVRTRYHQQLRELDPGRPWRL